MRDLKKIFVSLLLVLTAAVVTASFAACSNDPDDDKDTPKIDAKYTVTYYDDDHETLIDTKIFSHGETLIFPDIEREGFYTRWRYYDADGNEITDVDKVTFDIKLEAYYERIDCLVLIVDGVTDELIYECYHSYGDVFEVPELDTKKPGYEFLGFKLDEETEYRTTYTLTGSVTIVAEYFAYEYKLTFRDDTNDSVIDTVTVNYGEQELPSAPKKEGYEFDGWYMQINAVLTRVGGEGDTILITENAEIWARYTKKTENKA